MQTAILSNKHAVLSSMGSKYNDLYYSEVNSSVSLLETTFWWQNKISLPALNFGSSSQVNIPIDQFIQEVVLHLRLPPTTAAETIPRGWGYAMLQSIEYVIGGSSTTAVVLQEDAILQTILAQCTTNEKRSEVLRLSGAYQSGVPSAPIDQPPGQDPLPLDAFLIVPLPFSTACDKLPIDSTLLSNNIVVKFNFKSANAIYGGTGDHPTAFTVAEVMLRQGKLSNQAASLRQEMIAHPDLICSYPFIHSQYFSSAPFNGSKTAPVNVQLNSFTNADLVGIAFWVVREDFKSPVAPAVPNPYVPDPIQDVLITFNGSTLFNFPGLSYRLTGLAIGDQVGSASFDALFADNVPPPPPARVVPSWMIFLDFARLRSACMQDHLYNTWRIPNQNMNVQFRTAYDNSFSYRLHATYFYNGIIEMQGGTSAIYLS